MDFSLYLYFQESLGRGAEALEEALSRFKPESMSDFDIKKCIRAFRRAVKTLPSEDAKVVQKVLDLFQSEADKRGLKVKDTSSAE